MHVEALELKSHIELVKMNQDFFVWAVKLLP